MFDITSGKLLILAIVALIVVGPKDLPVLLRTVAKYLGIIRHHANEFRAQLDDALREAEFDDLKKEFDSVGREMKETLERGGKEIESNIETARKDVDGALDDENDKITIGADKYRIKDEDDLDDDEADTEKPARADDEPAEAQREPAETQRDAAEELPSPDQPISEKTGT